MKDPKDHKPTDPEFQRLDAPLTSYEALKRGYRWVACDRCHSTGLETTDGLQGKWSGWCPLCNGNAGHWQAPPTR